MTFDGSLNALAKSQEQGFSSDDVHKTDDVDFDDKAHHHTLGLGRGQAASGLDLLRLRSDFEAERLIASLHGNPDFELEAAGVPTVWDYGWGTGTVATEKTDTLTGSNALAVNISTVQNFKIAMSNTFPVTNGDIINIEAWARRASANAVNFQIGLLTRKGGTPNFFDAASKALSLGSGPLGDKWTRFSEQHIVPGKHNIARMWIRCDSAIGGQAVNAKIDRTRSKYGGNTAFGDTDWTNLTLLNAWVNFDTGLQTVTNGRDGQIRRVNGIVYHRGIVRSGAPSTIIFVQPVGFRCEAQGAGGSEKHIPVSAFNAYGSMQLNSNGNVFYLGGSNVWVDLSGIAPYPADFV